MAALYKGRVEDRWVRPRLGMGISQLPSTLILTTLLLLVAHSFVQAFVVEGHSMQPTLQEGERVLVNKAEYWSVGGHNLFGGPERGDVVVLRSHDHKGKRLIKRVVGFPGDVVEVRAGQVWLNGAPLGEPHLHEAVTPPSAGNTHTHEAGTLTSPEEAHTHEGTQQPSLSGEDRWVVRQGEVFVMGDNQIASHDSRNFGTVAFDDVVGEMMLRYWPLNR